MRILTATLGAVAALLLTIAPSSAQLVIPIGESPADIFINRGELGCDTNIFPQINAVIVNNEGQLCIGSGGVGGGLGFITSLPYEFSNLQSFVNHGSIRMPGGALWTRLSTTEALTLHPQ
jgi:hypothetical protein